MKNGQVIKTVKICRRARRPRKKHIAALKVEIDLLFNDRLTIKPDAHVTAQEIDADRMPL